MAGMCDADWFCGQVEQLKPTMFRVAYAILRCEADCEDAAASAVLRAYRYFGSLRNLPAQPGGFPCVAAAHFEKRVLHHAAQTAADRAARRDAAV